MNSHSSHPQRLNTDKDSSIVDPQDVTVTKICAGLLANEEPPKGLPVRAAAIAVDPDAPGQGRADQAGPDQAGPDQAGPEQAGPEQAVTQTHLGRDRPGGDPTPHESLEGAKTVITGSHRAGIPTQPTSGGTPAEIARVLLGHQLDHFHLETLIGGGGMGAVFRARDTRLDRTVAIKVIPRVGEDPELQRRFRNEAQSAARLDHPNIARVYDVGRYEGWHYIVFEYIEGTNLRDLVARDGLLSVDDAVYYTRQVAEALDHAHRRGVTHRDIKPSNVLVTPDGQVKLVDMGLARAQQLEMSEDMTASGVTLGTFDYISPEQARDPRDADVRSDIYSLGCTLYFVLTGRPPYPSGTVLQKLLSHGSSPPPDPRLVRSGLSENLVAVLHKMLAKQPTDRYRRPLDLISDLYSLAEREHLPRSLSAGSIALVQPSRFAQLIEHHLPWLLPAVLLVIVTAWLQLLSSAGGDLLTTYPAPIPGESGARAVSGSAGAGTQSVAPQGPVMDGANGALEGGAGGAGDFSGGAGDADASSNPETPPKYADVVPPEASLTEPAPSVSEVVVPPAESPRPRPSVIRVIGAQGDGAGTIDAENRLLVTSLEEAFEAASEDVTVTVIEIGATTVRCGPLVLPRKGLLIRGLSEASVLELTSSEPSSMERPAMFDLAMHSVDFENLHFVWHCPSMAVDGGTLFTMRGGNTLRFSNCSITIENIARRPAVYAFETTSAAPSGNPPSLVAIRLINTVVRGEATMWRLDRAASLVEFRWDNGLLAVSGSMIETGGAATSIGIGAVRMRLTINDVTAVPGEGLVYVRLESGAAQPIVVDREANRCVFSLDQEVPLVEIRGLEDASAVDRLVVLRGHDNAYDSAGGRTQEILRAITSGAETIEFGISDFLAADKPQWIQENIPQPIVVWSGEVPVDKPMHQHRPEDYLQEGAAQLGFRIDELPKMPSDGGVGAGRGI